MKKLLFLFISILILSCSKDDSCDQEVTGTQVEEIKTVGETFDPEVHEAVSSIQDETKGEKEVVQEFRKGYKIGTKVIRHAMVVVAN